MESTQRRGGPPRQGSPRPRKATYFGGSAPGAPLMTACIVGWAHTPFGRLEGETVESLIVRVASEGLADAGVPARDVDEIVLGHFNGGFSPQGFTPPLVFQAPPPPPFHPAHPPRNPLAP